MKNVKPPETSSGTSRRPRANPASMRSAPGREAQPLVVDAFKRVRVKPGEQRDAARAGSARKSISPRIALCGDRGDLRLDAAQVGDFVDAFDRDQRRIHVHRDQPDPLDALLGRARTEVDVRLRAELGDAGALARRRQAERLRRCRGERHDRVAPVRCARCLICGVPMSGAWMTRCARRVGGHEGTRNDQCPGLAAGARRAPQRALARLRLLRPPRAGVAGGAFGQHEIDLGLLRSTRATLTVTPVGEPPGLAACARRSAHGGPRRNGSSRCPSSETCTRPSILRPSSVTNRPKPVTPLTVPAKVSPTWSCMK